MGRDPKLGRGVLRFGSAERKWVAWVADRNFLMTFFLKKIFFDGVFLEKEIFLLAFFFRKEKYFYMAVIWVAGRTRTPIIGSLQKYHGNLGCKSLEGEEEMVASLVCENRKFLDKVNIYPSWIKHVKPIQYLLIISPFNLSSYPYFIRQVSLVFPRSAARLFACSSIYNNMSMIKMFQNSSCAQRRGRRLEQMGLWLPKLSCAVVHPFFFFFFFCMI